NPNDSFAISLHFENGKPPRFEPIFHTTVKRKVKLQEPQLSPINLDFLCSLLKEPQYEREHHQMTLEAYKRIHTNLLRAASPFPLGDTLTSTLKEIAATVLGRRKGSKNTLYL